MAFELTNHARFEMARRQISEDALMTVLETPEQVVGEREGLVAYQSRIELQDGTRMLVRAIVDEHARPRRVITVYRTRKIEKYWRQA